MWDGQIGYTAREYAKIVGASGVYAPNLDGSTPEARLNANGVTFTKVFESGALGTPAAVAGALGNVGAPGCRVGIGVIGDAWVVIISD